MRQRRLLFGAVAVLLLAAFTAGAYLSQRRQSQSSQPTKATIEKLLATPMTYPDGRNARLSDLRGKPLIVNFWATWCPPCLKEMPLFSELQGKHPNIQFVGIAVDTPDNVRNFVANHRLSYPVLIGPGNIVSLMAELGNDRNGLPFTLSLDTEGRPRHAKLGGLTESETERIISDLSGS